MQGIENKEQTVELNQKQRQVLGEMDAFIGEVTHKKQELLKTFQEEKKPRKITRAFIKSEKLVHKLRNRYFKTPLPLDTDIKEPLLLLMKENGYTELIQNVKSGEFIIKTPKTEKSILLTPDKLTTLKLGGDYYKGWIIYENCMTPYPEDPIYSSEMFRKTTQKLAMNWRDRDETALFNAKTKFWLYIIGGVIIAVILFISTDAGRDFLMNIGKKETVTAVAQTIQQNVSANQGIVVS